MPCIDLPSFNSSVSCCLWQICEPEEFFWPRLQLLPADADSIRALKTPFRRLERLACRQALSRLLKTAFAPVEYAENGAPTVPDSFVSFSHCKNYAAAAISPSTPIGIDVEPVGDRILRLQSKFVNDNEKEYFDIHNPEHVHLIWGAKEAMYKCVPNAPVDFLHKMTVAQQQTDNQFIGIVNLEKIDVKMRLSRLEINGLMLVVAERITDSIDINI